MLLIKVTYIICLMSGKLQRRVYAVFVLLIYMMFVCMYAFTRNRLHYNVAGRESSCFFHHIMQALLG